MDKCLKDKVVVVTGSAEGIGYEIVDKYLTEGAKIVILLDINETKGEEAVSKLTAKHGDGKSVFIKCDVTKDLEEVTKNIFDKYKQVDVLVNNAGIVDEFSARRVMEINSTAVIEWSMKFWEHMRKDKSGHGGTIINIGSMYSYVVDPYLIFYKASKYSVMGFTRALGHADNFEKFGVRVVILCPGFTRTALVENPLCWEEQATEFAEFIALQSWQQVEEVGKAAVAIFKAAESGSAWKIIGGVLSELALVADGDKLR